MAAAAPRARPDPIGPPCLSAPPRAPRSGACAARVPGSRRPRTRRRWRRRWRRRALPPMGSVSKRFKAAAHPVLSAKQGAAGDGTLAAPRGSRAARATEGAHTTGWTRARMVAPTAVDARTRALTTETRMERAATADRGKGAAAAGRRPAWCPSRRQRARAHPCREAHCPVQCDASHLLSFTDLVGLLNTVHMSALWPARRAYASAISRVESCVRALPLPSRVFLPLCWLSIEIFYEGIHVTRYCRSRPLFTNFSLTFLLYSLVWFYNSK